MFVYIYPYVYTYVYIYIYTRTQTSGTCVKWEWSQGKRIGCHGREGEYQCVEEMWGWQQSISSDRGSFTKIAPQRIELVVNGCFLSILWSAIFFCPLKFIDWFWLPIFCTNLVRGPWNKEMKFHNEGAVLVQIAPLFI